MFISSLTLVTLMSVSQWPADRGVHAAGAESTIIYEAKQAVLSGAIVDTKHTGFSGTGFVDYYPNTAGGSIEWTVEVPTAGEYTLAFRYANGGVEDRPVTISINGTVLQELALESTVEWTNWQTTYVKVALQAGQNVIRATASGMTGGANIDYLGVGQPSDEQNQPPVESEVEVTDLNQLINGLLKKKLQTLGVLAKEGQASETSRNFPVKDVKIEHVHLVGKNLVAVTLDSKFESFDFRDIALDHKATGQLKVKRAAVGTNPQGNTVLMLETFDPFHQEKFINEDKIYAAVTQTNSTDVFGSKLKEGDQKKLKDLTEEIKAIPNKLTVSKDGLGDFATVQGAIDAVPVDNTERVEILIHDGVYKEVVTIPRSKPFIDLRGESANGTIITYDNYSGKEKPTGGTYGTSGSASVYLYADDFTAENITFENSFDESSVNVNNKQAVAVYTRGDRMTFKNVRFIGNQDTLYTNGGSQYFYQCYIEGDVDFIFGGARAVFEDCDIVSHDRGSSTNNGYVTAASTLITEPYGYLFINSRLLSNAPDGTVHLGRPWHPGGNPDAIASVVFINCYLGAHINPQGWTDMSGFLASDARFYEYQNYGPGAVINESRRQLTDEEAQAYTIENVLKGWNPKE